MADETVEAPAEEVAATTPTKKASGAKKGKTAASRSKPSHPRTSDMVNNAIKSLKERGGSSLQAIKKYVAANYKVDVEKLSPFIKKYIKGAVASGTLVQTKGKGASGSFKLAPAGGEKAPAPKAKKAASKRKSPSKAVKASPAAKKPKVAAKKPASPAKKKAPATTSKRRAPPASPAASPAVAEKKAVAAKTKSPSKAKKSAKVPTKKPKSPKPKKAGGAKPKKAAAKKK